MRRPGELADLFEQPPPSGAQPWGISSAAFLTGYALAAVLLVAALAVTHARLRRHARAAARRTAQEDPLDAYLLAHLTGRALPAAVAELYATGLVRRDGALLLRTGAIPNGAPALEQGILTALDGPRGLSEVGLQGRMYGLSSRPPVREELRALDRRLDDRRFDPVPAPRLVRVVFGLPLIVLLALGMTRSFADFGNRAPVLGLIAVMAGLTAVVMWMGRRAVLDRVDVIAAELDVAWERHAHLDPSLKPSWTADGPRTAAVAVALFGAGAVWESAPEFAAELTNTLARLGPATIPGESRRYARASGNGWYSSAALGFGAAAGWDGGGGDCGSGDGGGGSCY
jgi:uncharacterized protein (TIGR04222 family)